MVRAAIIIATVLVAGCSATASQDRAEGARAATLITLWIVP